MNTATVSKTTRKGVSKVKLQADAHVAAYVATKRPRVSTNALLAAVGAREALARHETERQARELAASWELEYRETAQLEAEHADAWSQDFPTYRKLLDAKLAKEATTARNAIVRESGEAMMESMENGYGKEVTLGAKAAPISAREHKTREMRIVKVTTINPATGKTTQELREVVTERAAVAPVASITGRTTAQAYEAQPTRVLKKTIRVAVHAKAGAGAMFGKGAVIYQTRTESVETLREEKVQTYADTVAKLATYVADKYIRAARIPCAHLRREFIDDGMGAVNTFLALRATHATADGTAERFGRICPNYRTELLYRFCMGGLNTFALLAVHKAIRKAMDARLSRMARVTTEVEPAYFNACMAEETTPEAEIQRRSLEKVSARFAFLRARIEERTPDNGNGRRAAATYYKFVDMAEAYFVASIHGYATKLPDAGLSRRTESKGTSLAVWFDEDTNRITWKDTDAKGEVAGTKNKGVRSASVQLSPNALYNRISRLADFLGCQDIALALNRSYKVTTTTK